MVPEYIEKQENQFPLYLCTCNCQVPQDAYIRPLIVNIA